MDNQATESGDDATQSHREGRACERESGSQSGPGEGPTDTPGDEFERIWESLTDNQKKWAQAYIFETTLADAARRIGLSPSTVYSWPDYVEDAASMLVDRRAEGIQEGMSALSPAAIDVLRRALDPGEDVERVEAESAQYLLNQLEGKPTQKSEVDVTGGIDVSDSDAEELGATLDHLDADE